jgi:hypothetical protein
MVLLFVVCGWREETVAGVCQRMYLVHSTYVLFCTRATIYGKILKSTVLQNTNVIGDLKKNTICPLGRYDKIGVFLCVETKHDSCMCVVLTDLPMFLCFYVFDNAPMVPG